MLLQMYYDTTWSTSCTNCALCVTVVNIMMMCPFPLFLQNYDTVYRFSHAFEYNMCHKDIVVVVHSLRTG